MLTDRDPHYALGREHAGRGLVPYQWADPEHQRRYDAGYASVVMRSGIIDAIQATNERLHRQVYDQLQRLRRAGMSVKDSDDDDAD